MVFCDLGGGSLYPLQLGPTGALVERPNLGHGLDVLAMAILQFRVSGAIHRSVFEMQASRKGAQNSSPLTITAQLGNVGLHPCLIWPELPPPPPKSKCLPLRSGLGESSCLYPARRTLSCEIRRNNLRGCKIFAGSAESRPDRPAGRIFDYHCKGIEREMHRRNAGCQGRRIKAPGSARK